MGKFVAGRSLKHPRTEKNASVAEVVQSLDSLREPQIIQSVIETKVVEKVIDEVRLMDLKDHFDSTVKNLQSSIDHKNDDVQGLYHSVQEKLFELSTGKADKEAVTNAIGEVRNFQNICEEQFKQYGARISVLEAPKIVPVESPKESGLPGWVKLALVAQTVAIIALSIIK
jgi:hypothetical protein